MTIAERLKSDTQRFADAGFDVPDVEAAYLLSEITGIRHNLLLSLHAGRLLTPAQLSAADAYLTRRLRHEPYQYICGWAAFRELDLLVGPGVLIPRPETELLVDIALRRLPSLAEICEIGVGSGAISLSLAYERPDSFVTGIEISLPALAWAKKNLAKYALNNVVLLSGDLLEPVSGRRFDLIVANLPYIPERCRAALPDNVRGFEPDCALFAPDDGFALIDRTIRLAPDFLKPGGRLLLEMGEDQGGRALAAASSIGQTHVSVLPDQYGVDRFFLMQCF